MARVTAEKVRATRAGLLKAASSVLRTDGYAGLSTRGVASAAGVPMSQIQYHFGSKQGLLLALFEDMNDRLLHRQAEMFSSDLPLSQQWKLACDFLDEDIDSGYVRILNELSAAGWSNPEIGDTIREGMSGWNKLLIDVIRRASERHGGLGPFTPEDVAALVVSIFLGAEMNILCGHESPELPARNALRRCGDLIRIFEQSAKE